MIISYIVISIAAGLLASLIAALSGESLFFLWCVYTVVGVTVVIILAGVRSVLVDFFYTIESDVDVQDCKNIVEDAPFSTVERQSVNGQRDTELRILVVDDDPFTLDLIKVITQNVGISSLVTASSGKAALALLADPSMIFNYFLIDIKMADMDGIELCQRLRDIERYRRTPITMLTAIRDVAHMSEAFRGGADDYITKPFDIAKFGLHLRLAKDRQKLRSVYSPCKGGVGDGSLQIRETSFKRFGSFWQDRRNPLVDEKVLSTYLTRLPQKALRDIRIFAVIIDRMDAAPEPVLLPWRRELRGDLADSVEEALDSNLAIMAFTEHHELLVVTCSASPLNETELETDIEWPFRTGWTRAGYRSAEMVIISVGGPVQLRDATDKHNTFATDRALILAEDQIAYRQRRSLIALRKV